MHSAIFTRAKEEPAHAAVNIQICVLIQIRPVYNRYVRSSSKEKRRKSSNRGLVKLTNKYWPGFSLDAFVILA